MKAAYWALILSACSGLIYEIVLTDILFYYFIKSSYSLAVVLSIFLLGLGIGSYLVYKLIHKIRKKKLFFGILQVALGVYAFTVLVNTTKIIPKIGTFGLIVTSFLILIIPTIFLGAIFPLAGAIIKRKTKNVIGLVYAVDIAGAVFGSLLAGFVLIPLIGNRNAIFIGAAINFISAAIILKKWKKAIPVVLIILTVAVLYINLNDNKAQKIELQPEINENISQTQNNTLIQNSTSFPKLIKICGNPNIFKASPFGEVRVINCSKLIIDSAAQCSTEWDITTGENMIAVYSLVPFNSKDINVLNIGLGCGMTLSTILKFVNKTVDVVEINPVVAELNKIISDVQNDSRVNIIINEGYQYLNKNGTLYDSIIIDIQNPAVIHSSNLYTVEAFGAVKSRLKDNGIFGLWSYFIRTGNVNDIVYNSLKSVFQNVYVIEDVGFIASDSVLPYKEYTKKSNTTEMNTLDHKILSKQFIGFILKKGSYKNSSYLMWELNKTAII